MKKRGTFKKLLHTEIAFGSVSLGQKAAFAKHLSVMLKAGLTIHEALVIAEDAATGRLKRILSDVVNTVEGGNSFADALAKHKKFFRPLFIDVARAGEESGTLSESLKNIATQLKKEKLLTTKIRGALAYPIVVLIAAFSLMLGITLFVFPQILPLFNGLDIQLPITTRIVIWFSQLVQDRGVTLLLSIIAVVVFLVWFLKRRFMQPVTHFVTVYFPILRSLTRNTNLMRFNLTLGILLRSGLNLDEALAITKNTLPNFYYRKILERTLKRLQGGSKIYEDLSKHPTLFPKLVTSMIRVGEESGKLDESLLYLADFYEAEVDTTTKALTTLVEPLILIIVGFIVAVLALSIITPIYEITGNITP